MNALHGHFKPEFLNRVDDVIVFRPLAGKLVKIIELRLEMCDACWRSASFTPATAQLRIVPLHAALPRSSGSGGEQASELVGQLDEICAPPAGVAHLPIAAHNLHQLFPAQRTEDDDIIHTVQEFGFEVPCRAFITSLLLLQILQTCA